MVVQKDVFWKAGLFTLVVFMCGVLLGYFLESSRINEIRQDYNTIEKEWADAKLQTTFYQLMTPSFCEESIKGNLDFADRVYKEGLKLEKYEKSNRITNEILYDKERYVLLKLEFWLNSVYLKEKCKTSYTNLIYFYAQEPTLKQRAAQDTQADILKDLKDKYGAELMLIPVPIDINIATINILKEAYNIKEAPTLLINEKIKLGGVNSIETIEKAIKNGV